MFGSVSFRDRVQAGEQLAAHVQAWLARDGDTRPVVVLGLPRGGVPVAAVVVRDVQV